MAWDPATSQMLLFGGYTTYPSPSNDTWSWNGSTWTQIGDAGDAGCLSTCSSSPSARQAGNLVWDPATAQMVLFGGDNATQSFNDTWLWNGTSWSQTDDSSDPGCTTTCSASPLGRERALGAYDPATAQLVLFGGAGTGTYNDTWTWNGSSWSEIAADGGCSSSCPASPSARTDEWGDFDPATGQLVIFSGAGSADTWVWDDAPLALVSGSVALSTTLTGYDTTLSSAVSLEVANEGSSGWALTVQENQLPTNAQGHTLPAPSLNGSAASASASVAPAQACIGTCVPASGNAVTYPLTMTSGVQSLYTAAAGSGIGDLTLSLEYWQFVPGGSYADSGSNFYATAITVTLSFGP